MYNYEPSVASVRKKNERNENFIQRTYFILARSKLLFLFVIFSKNIFRSLFSKVNPANHCSNKYEIY